MPARTEQLLIDAIDIPLWLEIDHTRDWQERLARDRPLGLSSDPGTTDRARRVLAWWAVVDKADGAAALGSEIAALFRRLNAVMVVLGTLSGAGLAGAVLNYDGSNPINVLTVFGWLVLLPLGLLGLSVGLSLSSRFGRAANIGGVVLAFIQRHNAAVDAFFSTRWTHAARETLLRWQLLRATQLSGLAFSAAALGILLLKVSFTDLAFGWSTTLTVDGARLAGAIHWIAWPWSGWLPDAVPSVELIEQSRYFRLEDSEANLRAEALTAWWRFLAVSLAIYGVAVRTFALATAQHGLRRAARQLLLSHTEVSALIERLDTPLISSAADGTEVARQGSDAAAPVFEGGDNPELVIRWNGAGPATDPGRGRLVDAGGERAIDADFAAISDFAPPAHGAVRIVTKAWEPPLLEFHDYLRALRDHFGDGVSIVIQPLGENGMPPAAADLMVWRRDLARLQDPGIYVR